jgi:hypothetical protein
MCFSAEASFVVATTILVTGIISIKKAPEKQQLVFASIPLVFSIQQFTEGFLWIALKGNSFMGWEGFLTYFFLVFAQVVWPTWVPLAFYLLTKDQKRKKILLWLTYTGALVSLFLLYCLITYPIEAKITSGHIYYEVDYPNATATGAILYFIVTIFPAFISNLRWAWIIGILNLGSFIVSKLFFEDHVISVWCFMAAALSAMVMIILLKNSSDLNERNGSRLNSLH